MTFPEQASSIPYKKKRNLRQFVYRTEEYNRSKPFQWGNSDRAKPSAWLKNKDSSGMFKNWLRTHNKISYIVSELITIWYSTRFRHKVEASIVYGITYL
jgi:hypothetical protein